MTAHASPSVAEMARIARLLRRGALTQNESDDLADYVEQSARELEMARQWLADSARHQSGCAAYALPYYVIDPKKPCSCGLRDLIATLGLTQEVG